MSYLKTIYLVRHAQPMLNTGINYKVVPGPGLTEAGREQAREAGQFLLNCGVERLYASPLERARQTAQGIATETGLPITLEPLLREFDDPAESKAQLLARLSQFLQHIQHIGVSTVALVSHGSPVRELLNLLSEGSLDLKPYETSYGNPVTPAGIWQASRRTDAWFLDLVFQPKAGDWDRFKTPVAMTAPHNWG